MENWKEPSSIHFGIHWKVLFIIKIYKRHFAAVCFFFFIASGFRAIVNAEVFPHYFVIRTAIGWRSWQCPLQFSTRNEFPFFPPVQSVPLLSSSSRDATSPGCRRPAAAAHSKIAVWQKRYWSGIWIECARWDRIFSTVPAIKRKNSSAIKTLGWKEKTAFYLAHRSCRRLPIGGDICR